ncbi:MAG: MBL fold metallo-hydrolase [Armatimonadetes bacterium]|nr:MBL fold metallo-hydrolase [Armatimonadota bacterium]
MSLEFRNIAVGELQSNCYIIWDDDTRKAAIIDPGDEKENIIASVDTLNLEVEYVLLTHGHFDHIFVAGDIAERYGAPICMNAQDLSIVNQSLVLADPFYDVASFKSFIPSQLLNDGDIITLGSSKVKALHTPGHSQGGLCFATDAGVFCGDTIFAGSVGRTDLLGGSHEQLIESIRAKILTMDDSTPLYPGHGPYTTVGEEREFNFYLR